MQRPATRTLARTVLVVGCTLAWAMGAAACTAATVAFSVAAESGVTSHVEDDMVYDGQAGNSFNIDSRVGNPPNALSTSPRTLDAAVIFTRFGGGPFTFDEYDFASFADQSSETVLFRGLLGGSEVFSFQLSSSSGTFVTQPTGQAGIIDELRLTLLAEGSASLVMDNFDFTLVPEPSTIWLAMLGLAGVVGLAVRRRWREAR